MSRPDAALLVENLEKAAESFAPDELAYLALTSKIERPLQDRLAWSLHTQFPGLVVAREWKRADLAILDADASAPLVLLEAKAMYTFDVAGDGVPNTAKYVNRMRLDIGKAAKLDCGGVADLYALALVTHPIGVPRKLDGVVKYWPDIASSLRQHEPAALRQLAAETMARHLPALGSVNSGSLRGGEAFGVEVAVDWWLAGPAPRDNGPS